MEELGMQQKSEAMSDPFALPFSVNFAPFSAVPLPSSRRLSSNFTVPNRPVESARKPYAHISLQGLLVNAEEASSARSIGGGLSREEIVAWELFTPIQRFLIVAAIGVAASQSKKDRVIQQLQKSVGLRDQVLSNMQQKLDNLCEQLNLIKDQSGTGPNISVDDHMQQTLKDNFVSEEIKFIGCGCWLCDHHHHLLPHLQDKPLSKASMGNEMLNQTTNLITDAEPEERRMSDLSDWCSSVTSAAEINFNDISLDQDMLYLRKECQEKDATIKELTSFLHSTNKSGSKRTSELEDIIRRKNTIITRLKKDILVLEQKVTYLTRLQRSSSAGNPNFQKNPMMRDNLLYDMDVSTSPSSSDSETPVKVSEDNMKDSHSVAEPQAHKSAPAKSSIIKPVMMQEASPREERWTTQKPLSISSPSRQRRSSSTEASKKPKRRVPITSRASSGSGKRWV